MKDPMPINLMSPDDVRARGWQAESRDHDGHLFSTHVPFETDDDIVWFVRAEIGRGNTVTIWPVEQPT